MIEMSLSMITVNAFRRLYALLPAVLLLLLLAAALHALSSREFHRQMTQHALTELQQIVSNTRWRWLAGNDTPHGAMHDLQDLQYDADELAFTTGTGPYFALNLHRGNIAARYSELLMELDSSEATRMQLYFYASDSLTEIYGSEKVPVAAGRQTLRLSLDQLRWRAIPSGAPAQWGGVTRAVSLLRVDPADRAGIHMRIQRIELSARAPLQQHGKAITLENLSQAQVAETGGVPWPNHLQQLVAGNTAGELLLVNENSWLWQQTARARYAEIKRVAPDAIVFPGNASLLRNVNWQDFSAKTGGDALSGLRNPVYALSLGVSVFLLILMKLMHKRRPLRGSIVITELTGVLLLLACMWWIACYDQLWMLLLALPAFAITCVHLLRQQDGDTREILGLHLPSVQMWRETFLMSVIIVCLWSASFLFGAKTSPISWQALWGGFLLYPFWGLVQQFFMGPMLAATLARLMHEQQRHYPLCAILTACVFALLHYPNQQLMLMTLFTGSIWSWLYLRHRSIIPLAISHGILGTLYFQLSPDFLRPDGNVGPQYFDWLY